MIAITLRFARMLLDYKATTAERSPSSKPGLAKWQFIPGVAFLLRARARVLTAWITMSPFVHADGDDADFVPLCSRQTC
jgi:hypothetical protein